MKLKKLNENEIKLLDTEHIDKEETDLKNKIKKELSPIVEPASKELIKVTAKEEKFTDPLVDQPEKDDKTKLINVKSDGTDEIKVLGESVINEAPKLDPNYDSAKSFYGKAKWDEDSDGTKFLISYSTRVAEITPDGRVNLLPAWNYSQTTLRHVKEFLRQNGFKADSMKQMQHDYIDGGDYVVLGEDIVEENPQSNEEATGMSSLINSLIKDEWESIDNYKSAIITAEDLGINPDIIKIFNDIVTEEMIHVGQLEKAFQLVDPNIVAIEDGKAEAEKTIEDKIEIEEPIK